MILSPGLYSLFVTIRVIRGSFNAFFFSIYETIDLTTSITNYTNLFPALYSFFVTIRVTRGSFLFIKQFSQSKLWDGNES
jgi:hypothetical protein